jgi:hypothetical protein
MRMALAMMKEGHAVARQLSCGQGPQAAKSLLDWLRHRVILRLGMRRTNSTTHSTFLISWQSARRSKGSRKTGPTKELADGGNEQF